MTNLEGCAERAVRTLFCLLSNKHGYISLGLVGEMMQARSGNFQVEQEVSKEQIREAFQRLDLQKTNEVNYEMFKESIWKWLGECGFLKRVDCLERFQRGVLTSEELVYFNQVVLLFFFSSACDSPLYLSRINYDITAGLLCSNPCVSYQSKPDTVEDRFTCLKQLDARHESTKLFTQLQSKNLSTYQDGLQNLNELMSWTEAIQDRAMRFQFLYRTREVLVGLWKEEIILQLVSRILKDFSPHTQIISSTLTFLGRLADFVDCYGDYTSIALNQTELKQQLPFLHEIRNFLCSDKVMGELVELVAQLDRERYQQSASFVGKVISYGLLEAKDIVIFDLHHFLAHGFFQAQGQEVMVNGILGLIRNYTNLIKHQKVMVDGHIEIAFEDALCDELVVRISNSADPLFPLELTRVLLQHCQDETVKTLADKLPSRLHQLFLQETNIALRHIIYNIFKKFIPFAKKLSAKSTAAFTEMIKLSSKIAGGVYDEHYQFEKQFAQKLKAEALDFLAICAMQDLTDSSVNLFVSAPDDISQQIVNALLIKSKQDSLLTYQGIKHFLMQKLERVQDISASFKQVYAIEGNALIDANKVHMIFYLLRELTENEGVINYGFADQITSFLYEYTAGLDNPATMMSLKIEKVSAICMTLGVVAKKVAEWLSQKSGQKYKQIRDIMGAFKNKMKLLRTMFEQEVKEEKIEDQNIVRKSLTQIAKVKYERTDMEYEGEQAPTHIVKFTANESFPDFALKLTNNYLDDGEIIDLTVLYDVDQEEKIVVKDQASFQEMVSQIISESYLTQEYKCQLHVLYSMDDGGELGLSVDYNSLNIHCLECGLSQKASRVALINKTWKCEKCEETENYKVKFQ